ncbi:MAG: hypothetical protein Q9224_005263 [Gallowayella concinna]
MPTPAQESRSTSTSKRLKKDFDGRTSMLTEEWPQTPNLPGKPLDTALLLNRDHVIQLRDRIQNRYDDETNIPTQVVLSFLDNLDIICEGLCRQGPLRQNSLESCARVQETVQRIYKCTCTTRTDTVQLLAQRPASPQLAEPIEVTQDWNDNEVTLLGKDTLEKMDGIGTIKEMNMNTLTAPAADIPRDLKKHRKDHASRKVTLHILDPRYWNLKEAEVASRFRHDSNGLSLGDRPMQITLLPPGKIILKAPNVEGARLLRKIKPKNFGDGAYIRRFRPLDRELPN